MSAPEYIFPLEELFDGRRHLGVQTKQVSKSEALWENEEVASGGILVKEVDISHPFHTLRVNATHPCNVVVQAGDESNMSTLFDVQMNEDSIEHFTSRSPRLKIIIRNIHYSTNTISAALDSALL